MGLDTSHGCWRGAYSAFGRWRNAIAEAAGYAVWGVKYENGIIRDTVMIDWGHVSPENLMGEWGETPADPLLVIIAHADDDGVIHPAQAAPLADRLEGLLPALAELERRDPGLGHIGRAGGWVGATQRWIDGLRKAAAAGEDVTFG